MLDTVTDPIHAAIKNHAAASKALDAAAEALLEVKPTTLEGVYTLLVYVNDLTSEFGESASPRVDGQSFASRVLEHIVVSLVHALRSYPLNPA